MSFYNQVKLVNCFVLSIWSYASFVIVAVEMTMHVLLLKLLITLKRDQGLLPYIASISPKAKIDDYILILLSF